MVKTNIEQITVPSAFPQANNLRMPVMNEIRGRNKFNSADECNDMVSLPVLNKANHKYQVCLHLQSKMQVRMNYSLNGLYVEAVT